MGSLRKLERRLDNLRDAIYGHRYTSAPSICKSCECLLETLKDKFFCEWQLAMLDRPNVLSGDSDTFAISARPASDDLLDLSSSSDDNEDGESENGTEDEGEPCDSEDSHEAEPAKKKPRLEYHIPEGRMLQKLQKKGVTPERYRLNKAARKAKADVEAERPRILERLRIHSTMGVSMLLQPKSDPTLDPYPVILHPLARSAPSVKGSDSEVPAFPWYYDPPLARLNAPASPAFLPQVVPPDPRLSPPVHPRSVSPMSDEGLAMYQ
ncbi:hypothetical protein N7508_002460 [Penicillium antarcticum]|uniref:uncharacterized protein n=1 Tax=Penicillium antarcticum TaxID=416450 RepID=UPI00239D50EB|nr:uncharacterized protein N7508_002460 [Penicillium antarcticum]KAJ5317952.1 hypothetical protein N7508_002460 [Penicillium antarcticum]